jgi:hypothetical protein
MSVAVTQAAVEAIVRRAEARFDRERQRLFVATDRLFGVLMLGQWAFGILIALTLSPYSWEGRVHTVHNHVWAATVLGGIVSSLPLWLIYSRPGSVLTRHVVAAAQMLWSALLIHLTGGRIETHFHVFGSLGILAGYRDWSVLVTATLVVATDHLVRGIFWPESVYGVANPEWWRFLEHAFWVVFAVAFLAVQCRKGLRDMRAIAERGAELEALSENEWRKSSVTERDRDGSDVMPVIAGMPAPGPGAER